ncbi:hypothetical protein BUALT_Bualt04G0044700 [Buddleja alternifolia]|uniref:WEB family protein n=1 Tax=Buddleja alternifolia TaxID=168488 RepID=A0AAV6XTV4_9LAMI|nr:hypothetical protein BUALT_Bualt04G0044700 [Buddleja alternifolia]
MMREEEGLVVRGRVEIDMRRPFRSVREAVTLFGEKILAGETLKQMQRKAAGNGDNQNTMFRAGVTAELEETKQNLEKVKEEENLMANCLISLRQELEETKRELHQMKAREIISQPEPEIEDQLKFVESSTNKVETINNPDNDEDGFEFINKKRSVKFASPPLLTKLMVSKDHNGGEEGERTLPLSKNKIRRKPLVPLIGGLFSKKKKGSRDSESPRT